MRTHYDNLHIKKMAHGLIKSAALALLAINAGTVTAAIIDRQTSCGSISGCYEISGEITASDAIQARSLLAGRLIPMVFLNSPGGDLHAAIEIGTLLRSVRASAAVLQGASCESACVFLLAGAAQRLVAGRIGIHRPYSLATGNISPASAQAIYLKTQAISKQFLEKMNLPSALYDAMVRTPPEDMRYLSDREIAAFGLDAADPVEQEVLNSYYAGKYRLTKQEYLARKKAAYESCNPDLQRTGNADQYFLCSEQILTGPVPQHPSQKYQQAPWTSSFDPATAVQVDTAEEREQAKRLESHYRDIYLAHPDADTMINSQEFARWAAETEDRERIMREGTAAEVIQMFSGYKAHKASQQSDSIQKASAYQPLIEPSPCEIKQVMTNEDYHACGITPPSR